MVFRFSLRMPGGPQGTLEWGRRSSHHWGAAAAPPTSIPHESPRLPGPGPRPDTSPARCSLSKGFLRVRRCVERGGKNELDRPWVSAFPGASWTCARCVGRRETQSSRPGRMSGEERSLSLSEERDVLRGRLDFVAMSVFEGGRWLSGDRGTKHSFQAEWTGRLPLASSSQQQ